MWGQHLADAVSFYVIAHQSGLTLLDRYAVMQYATGWLVNYLEDK